MGDVFLIGDNWVSSPLNADGEFEFSRLLPGKYALEVKAVGYTTFRREFEIDEQDLVFRLRVVGAELRRRQRSATPVS